ncbi:CWC16 protein [Trema orientale]|uniref:CWC16 protein n=1 Tax=Trema orientale TaxID=63057 RepID=A0A2P5E710_TREOI|nr:CWC16 protein [Trema orientale]
MLPVTLPMDICCSTCENHMCKGTDVNFRKHDVVGETYRGAQIFRFHFNCTKCSAEIAIKPDPKRSRYVVESGGIDTLEAMRRRMEDAVEEMFYDRCLRSHALRASRELERNARRESESITPI